MFENRFGQKDELNRIFFCGKKGSWFWSLWSVILSNNAESDWRIGEFPCNFEHFEVFKNLNTSFSKLRLILTSLKGFFSTHYWYDASMQLTYHLLFLISLWGRSSYWVFQTSICTIDELTLIFYERGCYYLFLLSALKSLESRKHDSDIKSNSSSSSS